MNEDFLRGFEGLAPLAEQLDIDAEVLGNLLIMYPVGGGLSTDILLTERGRAIMTRLDAGEDPNDVEGADLLAKVATAYVIDDYFLDVAAHSSEYLAAIEENIKTLSQDIKPGESVSDCINRNLKKYNISVSINTIQPDTSIFDQDFAPILNNTVTNELVTLNFDSFTPIPDTKTATYTSKKGTKYTIKNIDKLAGNLSTGAKKLFYAALLELTNNNIYRSPVRRATVEIPLIDYGIATGHPVREQLMSSPEDQAKEHARVNEILKKLKSRIKRYLNDIKSIEIDREETRGYNRGDYRNMNLISSHAIKKGPNGPVIEINFDVKFAQYFNNSYVSWFPTALFKCDNRNPNEFAIGCKIALQNSIDNNVAKGTDTTITVRVLLENAPDIVTNFDELRADRSRYDWRTQIKNPLERSLNGLVKHGYLESWTYRNSKTGKYYTPAEAARLSWNTYYNLCVDFTILPDNPGRDQRSIDRLEAKIAAENEKTGTF